jgi:hypothetical protein
MKENNIASMIIPLDKTREDMLLRESERYKTACRYVLSTDYISKDTLIAILSIEEKTSENK